MPAIESLTCENALLEKLSDCAAKFAAEKPDPLCEQLAQDWQQSFDDNRKVNDAVMATDAGALQEDLLFENHLLAVLLKVIEAELGPGSPLSESLRTRWQDLFTRERDRNQEIIDAVK